MDTGRVEVEPTIWPPVLGRETPAVANLLINDRKLTRSAVSATLLDLAARGFISIESVAPHSYVRGDRPGDHEPRAYRVRPELVDEFTEGNRFEVETTRRLGYVLSAAPADLVMDLP